MYLREWNLATTAVYYNIYTIVSGKKGIVAIVFFPLDVHRYLLVHHYEDGLLMPWFYNTKYGCDQLDTSWIRVE